MQITHEEAHRLIQFDTDHALKPSEKSSLVEHLQACAECQAYAQSIKGMELILLPLLRRNWSKQPIPLSLASITGKRYKGTPAGAFMATRIAIVSMICLGFLFGIWQFTIPGQATPDVSALSVPAMPTPSAQFISMTGTANTCAGRPYVVKENDTLESIAQRFAVSKENILSANGLPTETLTAGIEILILTCAFTPTGTVNALTTTYTPSVITSTPGG